MNMSRTLDRQIPLWIQTLKTFQIAKYNADPPEIDWEGEAIYFDYLFYVAKEIGIPPMDLEDIVRSNQSIDGAVNQILDLVRNFGQ